MPGDRNVRLPRHELPTAAIADGAGECRQMIAILADREARNAVTAARRRSRAGLHPATQVRRPKRGEMDGAGLQSPAICGRWPCAAVCGGRRQSVQQGLVRLAP
jgi:hypothetical protein